jgi:parallel beta-helix repeat protein
LDNEWYRISSDQGPAVKIVTSRVIVKLRQSKALEDSDLSEYGLSGARVLFTIVPGQSYSISVPEGAEPFEFLDQLMSTPEFAYVEFPAVGHRLKIPNDPLYSTDFCIPYWPSDPGQWYLSPNLTEAPLAWDMGNGSGVLVGLVDSGVDYNHPDLGRNIWTNAGEDADGDGILIWDPVSEVYTLDPDDQNGVDDDGNEYLDDLIGWNFQIPDTLPYDIDGHGTNMAGIIGAEANNNRGIAGIAGRYGSDPGVKIIILKDGDQEPYHDWTAAAIVRAAELGAKVISVASWWSTPQAIIQDAIDMATDQYDAVIFSGTGNFDLPFVQFPASDPSVVAVGASDSNDDRAEWVDGQSIYGSQWGPEIDFVAPGEYLAIASTDPLGAAGRWTGDYNCFYGTSAAVAFASGAAAIVRGMDPSLTWTEVRDVLRDSADKVAGMNGQQWHEEFGYGRLNLFRAIVGAAHKAQVVRGQISTNMTLPDPNKLILSSVYAPADVEIPLGVTVVLRSGSAVLLPALRDDENLGGDPSRVEWIVRGTFAAVGTANFPIEFASVGGVVSGIPIPPLEGDWGGIYFVNGSYGEIQYADVQHATYGIRTNEDVDYVGVTHSSFRKNENDDVNVMISSGFPRVSITNNSITVGGGRGVVLESTEDVGGAYVNNNTIWLDSSSSAGILLLGKGMSSDFPVSGNNISGMYVGSALEIYGTGSWTIVQNQLKNCMFGVYVHKYGTGGNPASFLTPNIGTSSSSSDNTITGNTAGILADSSKARPKVRNNKVNSNTFGVMAMRSAVPNLGTSAQDKGNNTLLSNTTYCVWNRTVGCETDCGSGGIPAQGNYFGSVCEFPACWEGDVDVTNYLCSEPAAADIAMQPIGFPAIEVQSVTPNPMVSSTRVAFSLGKSSSVWVRVFDAQGRVVADLGRREYGAGENAVEWSGRSSSWRKAPAGVYFVNLVTAEHHQETAKVLVVN